MDIARILDDLAHYDGLPVEALKAADANRQVAVPAFLQAIEQFLQPDAEPRLGRNLIFFAFHLLGSWREKSAYRPLARLLRCPRDEMDDALAGARTETAHRVMAAVFDGDPQPLYDVILDPEADELVRSRMLDALAMLTLRGELPREETARFLRDGFADIQPQDECYVWSGWQGAIAMLGLDELRPLVRDAFKRGLIGSYVMHYEDNAAWVGRSRHDVSGLARLEAVVARGPAQGANSLKRVDARLRSAMAHCAGVWSMSR